MAPAVLLGVYLLIAPSSFSEAPKRTEQKPKSAALAAYEKRIYDVIGQRWYNMVQRDADLITFGTFRVSFSIFADGHVENLQTISNTSNQHFEMATRQVIEGAHLPPIPAALVKTLPGRRLDMEISFTTFSNPK